MTHFVTSWFLKQTQKSTEMCDCLFHVIYFDSCESSGFIVHVNISKYRWGKKKNKVKETQIHWRVKTNKLWLSAAAQSLYELGI